MKEEKKQIVGHVLACGTQMMWGATFVATKVLLAHFLPVQVLFTRVVIAFLMLWILFPHTLKIVDKKRELAFAGAGLFGIVLYFMLENTALTMTYASNVGIIVACAPFFVAVIVGIFFKNEKPGGEFLRWICHCNCRNRNDQYEWSEESASESEGRYACVYGYDFLGILFRNHQENW